MAPLTPHNPPGRNLLPIAMVGLTYPIGPAHNTFNRRFLKPFNHLHHSEPPAAGSVALTLKLAGDISPARRRKIRS
jgi:hypothetical protein